MPAPAPRLRPEASARCPQLIRTGNHHPACSEIVAEQGRCPWWVSRPEGLLRFAAAVPVTPTTPVGSFLGSSVELPSDSVRAEPPASWKVSEVLCRLWNASQAQESCQLCRLVPDLLFLGRDPSKNGKIEAIQCRSGRRATQRVENAPGNAVPVELEEVLRVLSSHGSSAPSRS